MCDRKFKHFNCLMKHLFYKQKITNNKLKENKYDNFSFLISSKK
jgi:hypothetical protein